MRVTLMVGLPGSGKSFWADMQQKPIICRDDIRLALGVEFDHKLEPHVTAVTNTMVRALMVRHVDFIIDETHNNVSTVKRHMAIAKEYSYSVNFTIMATPVKVCKDRRIGFPIGVIDSMAENIQETIEEIQSIYDEENILHLSGDWYS